MSVVQVFVHRLFLYLRCGQEVGEEAPLAAVAASSCKGGGTQIILYHIHKNEPLYISTVIACAVGREVTESAARRRR